MSVLTHHRIKSLLSLSCLLLPIFLTVSAPAQPVRRPSKPIAAVYIMGNPDGRELIKRVVFNAVANSGKFYMLDLDTDELTDKYLARYNDTAKVKMFNKSWGYRLGAQFLCIVKIDKEKGITYITISMVNTDTKEALYAGHGVLTSDTNIFDLSKEVTEQMLSDPPDPPASK
jgi:hypothetical protein